MIPFPERTPEQIAILRRDYVVRRYPLDYPQFVMLQKILGNATIREAISAAAEFMDADDDSVAASLQSWFRDWSSAGFFVAISA